MSSFPFNPMTSPDAASPEQNIQLQPSTYQTDATQPNPPATTSTTSSSTSSTSSSSGSHSGSGDNVTLSFHAQAKQLSQQGMSAANIAQTLGTTVASVDTLLNITPTTTTNTSSSSSTTSASKITL
jgi:hypothetical protein